jgi:hypothetical protein
MESICAVTLGIGPSFFGTVSLLSILGFTVIWRPQVPRWPLLSHRT